MDLILLLSGIIWVFLSLLIVPFIPSLLRYMFDFMEYIENKLEDCGYNLSELGLVLVSSFYIASVLVILMLIFKYIESNPIERFIYWLVY